MVYCTYCRKQGHHTSKCWSKHKKKDFYREKQRCSYCREQGHVTTKCRLAEYHKYSREQKYESYYMDTIEWKRRRLLYIGSKNDLSLISILPMDIIKCIDKYLKVDPFQDLISIIKQYRTPDIVGSLRGSSYTGNFTIIQCKRMKLPKSYFDRLLCSSQNPDYLFVIKGHIDFSPYELKIIKYYQLRISRVTTSHAGPN